MKRCVSWMGLLSLLLLSSCKWTYNQTESHYTHQLLTKVLKTHQFEPRDLACQMMEMTRDFRCTLSLNAAEFKQLQSRLSLQTPALADARHRYTYQRYLKNCESEPAFAQPGPALYAEMAERRSPQLPHLELFTLYYRADLGQACLHSAQRLLNGPT
ncbi:MAG: hypothetical protein ACO1RX_11465 [Candidatus Sericytochromatia bacterium]